MATGLAFESGIEETIPKSLANIYRELESDLNTLMVMKPRITNWAEQGVLMLNTILTTREGQTGSHKDFGWQKLTSKIIELIADKDPPAFFILWGDYAKEYALPYLNIMRHSIIISSHPSPLSAHRGFFGSKPFSRVNKFLKEIGEEEIKWV